MAMLGGVHSSEDAAEERCRASSTPTRAVGGRRQLLASLAEHHPRPVRLALPVLFDESRSVITALLAER